MTDDQEQDQEDVIEEPDQDPDLEPVEAPRGPTGPAGPIGSCPALADADEDPDVLAAADMTDAPAEPIVIFLRAAADRLDEERRDEGKGEPPEEGPRFNFSLEVRRHD